MLSRLARRALAAYRRSADLRWRQPPHLNVHKGQSGPPAVYYLAPTRAAPSGGIRVIYQHVAELTALGVRAAVVHDKPGFRVTWFANDVPVVYPSRLSLGPRDLFVIPECYGAGLHRLPPEARVVVFNQGAYHTFDGVPLESTRAGDPYASVPGLAALLTVSRDSAELLRYAFEGVPVHLTRPVVDATVYHPASRLPGRRIGYLTHRRPQERHQLLHLLRARGMPEGWRLTPIHGTQAETAALMRECAIFLSFSEREGFGLPPAEAMASGCHVVGYTGMGGREFFDPAYCTPVPDGDLLAFARAITDACAAYDADPDAFAKTGLLASERILSRYSPTLLREDLQACYTALGVLPDTA